MPLGAGGPAQPPAGGGAASGPARAPAAVCDDEPCSICFGGFREGDGPRTRLARGHDFHVECVIPVVILGKGVLKCPVCRAPSRGDWRLPSNSTLFTQLFQIVQNLAAFTHVDKEIRVVRRRAAVGGGHGQLQPVGV